MSNLYNYRATFISTYNANTITTDIDLGFGAWLYHEKLQLLGIHIQGIDEKLNSNGTVTRDCIRGLLTQGDVIEIKTYKDDGSENGRWQAEVILPDGRSLNKVLLAGN